MKKIILSVIILLFSGLHVYTAEKKPKFNTDSTLIDWIKNKDKKKPKFNTDSTMINWIKNKDKKIPNPISGLKKVGKALKPDIDLSKK
jgi:hypothetical protein